MSASSKTPDTAHPSLAAESVLQNRYCIVRQLGRGGMGAVYEAIDQRLGITVALKETFSSEESTRKQFEHEAKLLAGMQHPALPRVTDHFVEGERAFLVMQFIGGVDLARIMAQQPGPLPRDQVIAWADQLLDALMYLHSRDRQVIHRDIKPHNLKLTASGQIALLDFGLAKAQQADASVTSSRAFFGYSRHYAPLEQIQDQRTDPRIDIYALGATLYHLLTGTKPPDALVRAAALVNSEPDPLRPANKVHAAVGSEIAAILSKAMAQNSEERYRTASEFREALRRVGRSQPVTPRIPARISDYTIVMPLLTAEPPVLSPPMVASARRFGPGAITAVLVVVLMLVAGVLFASQLLPGSPALDDAASASTAVAQHPLPTRKPERVRSSNNAPAPVKKTKDSDNADHEKRAVDEKEVVRVTSPQVRPARKQGSAEPRKVRRPIDAPSIRFPNPAFPEYAVTPAGDLR